MTGGSQEQREHSAEKCISARRLCPDKKGEDMSALRRLRNFWILWVTTIVLACFSDAVAQASYKVTDLGTLHNGYFGCTMGLNNHGWTETQYGELDASGKLEEGRVAVKVDAFTLDLGALAD